MNIPLLDDTGCLPDLAAAVRERDGLVGASTDLSVARLLTFYPHGMFPWHGDGRFFYWFTVSPRAVLYPAKLHIGRSLAKTLRHKPYAVSVNRAFASVIAACAAAPREGQQGTWIGHDFQVAYTRLHQSGHAHSFECWYPDGQGGRQLAGGLYGVQIGCVFFGESMFARQSDASKIAFAHAVPYLAECGVQLIDCQMHTAHLARFGSENLPLADFQVALQAFTRQSLTSAIGSNMLHVTF